MPTYVGDNGPNFHVGDEDVMYGLDGVDQLAYSGLLKVSIYGGGGTDLLSGGPGDDYLEGGEGSDRLLGSEGNDALYGGDGNDAGVYSSYPGENHYLGLFGGAGDDYLDGGRGTDLLEGGSGNDILIGGEGDDSGRILGGRGLFTPAGLYGGDGNDYLDGGQGNDWLYGGQDDDVLDGGAGDDWLYGGFARDVLIGGLGNDNYDVDSPDDRIVEASAQGTDVVFSYADYTLPDHTEYLMMVYGVQTYGYGNSGDNIVVGNDQANVLEGRAGYDTLFGGAGSDLFVVNPGFGVDVIADFVAGAGTADAVVFSQTLFTSFAQVMANAAQVGADTWIGDGNGNTVVLSGIAMSSLHPDDFGFI